MPSTLTEPIPQHWIPTDGDHDDDHHDDDHDDDRVRGASGTASALAHRLAMLSVGDLEPAIVPYLAAAAAELAATADISWRSSADALPVACLRLIAKVAIIAPDATGPHTARLLTVLAGANR